MKNRLLPFFLLIFSICNYQSYAQTESQSVTPSRWNASWISVPGGTGSDYEICLFRESINIAAKPATYLVHVSGDNRYELFVNGKLVSIGPARGDFYYWNYETVDLAPYLTTGKNVISALVFNEGAIRPTAQMTFRTGFILQGHTSAEEEINTGSGWKCYRDSAYRPLPVILIYSYYAAGPGELVNMKHQPKNWQQPDFDDTQWQPASKVSNGTPKGQFTFIEGWMLVPSPIPARDLVMQRLQKIRRADGVTLPSTFPAEKGPVTIPAHTTVTILLDQTFLTNAYPTIVFSKGKDAGISMSYAEGMYVIEPNNSDWRSQGRKGNRDEIEGKRFVGRKDSIISDGSGGQQFTPLNWRTFRYLQLIVETKDEPLVIDDLYSLFTGYPFKYNAKLETDNNDLNKILEIGWRTARLCAWETYMDCPYYEQLQYVGDTRIQALVSYYNSGDDRLARNAITLLDHSRISEGITQSRYPTAVMQQIPTFSLWWIGMLHDYYLYRDDNDFVRDKLQGTRDVLAFFNRYQMADGSLNDPPYWEFTDWANGKQLKAGKSWNAGVAPIGTNGNSAVLDMQLLWAYQLATELESKLGSKEYASVYEHRAAQLKQTIRDKYWVAERSEFADRPEKDAFSQHANSLAILTGVATPGETPGIAHKLLTDSTMTPASIYFKYYLHQALTKAGLGNDYISWLSIWRENIKMGMTTWAEMSDIASSRSDCHAWGSSPNIELYRTVLGIESDAPGFRKVKIEPHLGRITHIGGEIPHPKGNIKVKYAFQNNQWRVNIALPAGTPGRLIWKGKEYALKAGENNLIL
ncbi:MAG TPA: alpha-L-rhamnosidase C-terminal domain-containing protein [Mucilaginibacter sp.]|jgi:alpha-L-rhamnosidase|nr:alpha-L-rhamnosidase C-terminal domain-containing protein [Mucilaginibacter sp.]